MESIQTVNSDLKVSLDQKCNELEEILRRKADAENKVLSCQESIDSLKAEVQRAKDEKEDLLSNIEAKEGINIALQQLKVENESMSDQIKSISVEKDALVEKNRTEVENLYQT